MTHQNETHLLHPVSRITNMTDAVLAITITLLGIRVSVFLAPQIISFETFLAFWAETCHHISIFLLGYIIIGWFWYLHNLLFSGITNVRSRVFFVNMCYVFLLCCKPFLIELLLQNKDYTGVRILFWAAYLLIIVTFFIMTLLVERESRGEEMSKRIKRIKNDSVLLVFAGSLSLLLSFFFPYNTLLLWGISPLILKVLDLRFFR